MQAEKDDWGYGTGQEAVGDGVEEGLLEQALRAL